jgi:3-(3-hydroxy-phenyl)propionate hydroxylase
MVFNQPAVDALLRGRAASLSDVVIGELDGLTQDENSVQLHLGDGRTASARYVVGCDGAASTVRRALGIEYQDLEFDQSWLVADLLVNPDAIGKLPRASIQYCEPARPSTYLIGVGAHRRWELMLNENEEPDAWKLLARWIGPAEAKLWRAAAYRFHALVARQWRRGRVFLAGDAAHQQPPFTGQGMCQGIRDVANLSWKLAAALRGKADESLLETYGLERGRHARALISILKDIGRIIGERDPAAARARDRRLLAQAGGKVVTVPRQDLIPPLEAGFLSPRPHPANGTVFPNDGARGMRIVLKAATRSPVLKEWFEKHRCVAAIVRPDHYVYGVADSEQALDRSLAEMGKLRP